MATTTKPARWVNRKQLIGVAKPDDKPAPHLGVCVACKKGTVWALDDRMPDNLTLGDLFNLEPDQAGDPPSASIAGKFVLWYQVDAHDKPIGKQMFRQLELGTAHQGPTWSPHPCGRLKP
jgi:hypothetical protein